MRQMCAYMKVLRSKFQKSKNKKQKWLIEDPYFFEDMKPPIDKAFLKRLNEVCKNLFKIIYDKINEAIERYRPEHMAIEELFFNDNAKTAIAVGQARGVIVLSAVNHGLKVFEYTPLQVKQAVVGYGRADKKQVQQMTRAILNLNEIPKPDDVADALAIAVCHAHSYNSSMEKYGLLK